jgi:hypothetical protein
MKPVLARQEGANVVRTSLVIAGIVAIWSCTALGEEYLSYDELIAKIREGSVKEISLTGRFPLSGIVLKNGVETEFVSHHPGGPDDTLLLELLRDRNVKIAADRTETPYQAPFLMLLPTLLFLAVPVVSLVLLLRINKRVKRVESAVSSPDSELTVP